MTDHLPHMIPELLHPRTETQIRSWHPDAGPAIIAAAARAGALISARGITGLEALPGGAKSLVAAGHLPDGTRVVVKAPLDATDADTEATALGLLPGCPVVLDVLEGALLLEHLAGVPAEDGDSTSLADAVRLLHGGTRPLAGGTVPSWESARETLLDEYVRRIEEHLQETSHPLRAVAQRAQEILPQLLAGPRTVCHGDLQAKNVLRSETQVRILDPFAIHAPAGWDVALAAVSARAYGGEGRVVLAAGENCGVGDLDGWLTVAGVAIMGTSRNVTDSALHARVLGLLASPAPGA